MILYPGHKFTLYKSKILIKEVKNHIIRFNYIYDSNNNSVNKTHIYNITIEFLNKHLCNKSANILVEIGDKFEDQEKTCKYEITKEINEFLFCSIHDRIHESHIINEKYDSKYIINLIQNNVLIPLCETKSNINLSMFPHKCPFCNNPAYIRADQSIDCSKCSGKY